MAATASLRLLAGTREPVRAATTANLELTAVAGRNYLAGLKTIDGIGLVTGDRVLVKNQTDAEWNGIYDVSAGKWRRSSDAADPRTLTAGILIPVQQGTVNATTYWRCETVKPNIGTDDIAFSEYLSGDLVAEIEAAQDEALEAVADSVAAAAASAAEAASIVGSGAWSQPSEQTRSVEARLRESIHLLDFVPAGEHADIYAGTSDYDVFEDLARAIDAVSVNSSGSEEGGPRIILPYGKLRLASTVELKKTVIIEGHGCGQNGGQGTVIEMEDDLTGFIFHSATTIGETGTEGSSKGAAGAVLRGFELRGGGDAGYGVLWRGKGRIDDLNVEGFGSHGLFIDTVSSGGNANNWRIFNSRSSGNGGCGLKIDGSDSNAGLSVGLLATNNGEWGIFDSGFLGNTHISAQATGNGLGSYKSDATNASHTFLGCYSESGQPEADIIWPSVVIGGTHGAGFSSTSDGLRTGLAAGQNNFPMRNGALKIAPVGNLSGDQLKRLFNATAAPASGDFKRGEIAFNRSAAIGSPVGWVAKTENTSPTAPDFISFAPGYVETTSAIDVPSLAAGATTIDAPVTVTVTGAAVGMHVSVSWSSAFTVGILCHADVSAANTVRMWFENRTAGTVDPSSRTAHIRVN